MSLQDIIIRPLQDTDHPYILALNERNVEVLSPMDADRLLVLRDMAELFSVAEAGGRPVAFLIALTEAASAYDSENYRWFRRRYARFLYIDRIVIDEACRARGLGRQMYRQVFAHAKERGIPCVTAEIDTIPYNAASLRFHRSMGFEEVGTQFVRGDTVRVSLQAKRI